MELEPHYSDWHWWNVSTTEHKEYALPGQQGKDGSTCLLMARATTMAGTAMFVSCTFCVWKHIIIMVRFTDFYM